MAIIDTLLEFSDSEDIGVYTAGANISDNIVPLSNARNVGNGDQLFLKILIVDEAVTSAGSATVNFKLVTDDNAAMSSAVTIVESGAIAKADLVIGYELYLPLPPSDLYEEFLAVDYFVGTATLTAGKANAVIIDKIQKTKSYPNGISHAV